MAGVPRADRRPGHAEPREDRHARALGELVGRRRVWRAGGPRRASLAHRPGRGAVTGQPVTRLGWPVQMSRRSPKRCSTCTEAPSVGAAVTDVDDAETHRLPSSGGRSQRRCSTSPSSSSRRHSTLVGTAWLACARLAVRCLSRFDGHREVDLGGLVADEVGVELLVELLGDVARESPGEHREAQRRRCLQRRLRCCRMIRVPRHSGGVEDDQALGRRRRGRGTNLAYENAAAHALEGAVWVVAELRRGQAQHRSRVLQLQRAQGPQVTADPMDRRRLALGQTQHGHRAAGVHQRVENGPQPERLIVGMGHHRQRRSPAGQHRLRGWRPRHVPCHGPWPPHRIRAPDGAISKPLREYQDTHGGIGKEGRRSRSLLVPGRSRVGQCVFACA